MACGVRSIERAQDAVIHSGFFGDPAIRVPVFCDWSGGVLMTPLLCDGATSRPEGCDGPLRANLITVPGQNKPATRSSVDVAGSVRKLWPIRQRAGVMGAPKWRREDSGVAGDVGVSQQPGSRRAEMDGSRTVQDGPEPPGRRELACRHPFKGR